MLVSCRHHPNAYSAEISSFCLTPLSGETYSPRLKIIKATPLNIATTGGGQIEAYWFVFGVHPVFFRPFVCLCLGAGNRPDQRNSEGSKWGCVTGNGSHGDTNGNWSCAKH